MRHPRRGSAIVDDRHLGQGVTVTVPFITAAPWMEQKYENVPGC